MDPEISDAVTEWEPVAAGSGVAGLRSLAADTFSGAVTDGLTWAFFLNGRIIGVFDGSLDSFEGSDLTAYKAPDPSLPLLFSMRETGGETRGQYYTEETPLVDVDRKLSSGNFTGYVELSENVLSGDYYLVYHGGRSMNVAFVGASERLVTEDEAFELAADEVGIYTVTAVDVTVTELPEGDAESGDIGGAAAVGTADEPDFGDEAAADEDAAAAADDASSPEVTFGGAAGGATADSPDDDEPATANGGSYAASDDLTGDMGIGLNVGGADSPDDVDTHDDEPQTVDAADETDDEGGLYADEHDGEHADSNADEHDGEADVSPESEAGDDSDDGRDDDFVDEESDAVESDAVEMDEEDVSDDIDTDATERDDEDAVAVAGAEEADKVEDGPPGDAPAEPTGIDTEVTNGKERGADAGQAVHGLSAADASADADEAPARSNDPQEQSRADTERQDAGDESGVFSAERAWQETRRIPALSPDDTMDEEPSNGQAGAVAQQVREEPRQRRDAESGRTAPADAPASSPSQPSASSEQSVPGDEEAVDELEAQLASVTEERDALAEKVDSLESNLETVTRERDKFRVRIADLESEIERLRDAVERQSSGSVSDGPRLSPTEARQGTNLFVRYRSKGKPTLEKARTGDAKQSEVVENLRLEYHTTFDSEAATVDGQAYEEFLGETTEWAFVTWVVEELLYEIGRAGHRTALAPLFDAIPEIDRIQFDGEVPVTIEENGKEVHESRTFDLVFWNSMGDPLFVVNVDTDRNATTQNMVGSLIAGARAVGGSKDTLSAAFYVSNSFFDPGALDAVGEATKSGLLSRDSKKSFVKLSRKDGYHLCLVEARSGEFHLTVPEL